MTTRTIKAKKGLITSIYQYILLTFLQFLLIPLILNVSGQERADLIAFLQTLTGNDVYTDVRWSNPFQ